jgi:alpha-glucosidase
MPEPTSAADLPWWKTAVVYQIYPRSFADSDGDGVGDLEGIRRHLDHLSWLGVDAIWISPFFRSPMADFGYDVSDYCDVDPLFGDLDAFDRLLADAHDRDLKVLIDWVPNHSSDQHPWFVASRSSVDDPKRDWYLWRDPEPNGDPPNNWIANFINRSAWTLDPTTDQMYLHLFLPEQPDLNWHNAEVVAAMHDTLRFWLDRGVDGFRMDVIHCIGKDPELADDPPDQAVLTHVPLNNRPETHELLRGIRAVLDAYDGDRTSVGEVYLLDTKLVAEHYGHGDELHMSFNFPPLFAPWKASSWRRQIQRVADELEPVDAWPTWVLSNHDVVRHRTRYGGSEARARCAAVMLLTLRGTPFVYAGEELGLENADVPADRVVDPGGRDGCRAPIPWSAASGHGWDGPDPWLPWSPHSAERSVEAERSDPDAILHLYRQILAVRRSSPALRHGDLELLDAPDDVLAYRRHDRATGDQSIVVVNFGDAATTVDLGVGTPIAVSSVARASALGTPFDGTIAGEAAVVLR